MTSDKAYYFISGIYLDDNVGELASDRNNWHISSFV